MQMFIPLTFLFPSKYKIASAAEERKACKDAMLGQAYCFVPIAI